MRRYQQKFRIEEGIRDEDQAAEMFISAMMESLRNAGNDPQMVEELGYEIGHRLIKAFGKVAPQYITEFSRGITSGAK